MSTVSPSPEVATRVLVVDDAATVRLYHGGVLREAGWEVSEAGNGYEALELSLLHEYDLFLVDVNMPRLDGYALVEALRREALSRTAPVVMISTESRDGDAERAYAAGANLYLVKPVGAEHLVMTARVLCGPRGAALSGSRP